MAERKLVVRRVFIPARETRREIVLPTAERVVGVVGGAANMAGMDADLFIVSEPVASDASQREEERT